MPLESCMILLDNSEYMRNGDYIPTRLEAQQDAANLLVTAKTRSHPESTVGVSAGTELLVSPTDDVGKILNALHGLNIADATFMTASMGTMNSTPSSSYGQLMVSSIQVASLALKHRRNKNGSQRIILFVGTPLEGVDGRALTRAAKQLKKNNVAIDVIAMGEIESNQDKLQQLIQAANGRNEEGQATCHFLSIPPGVLPSDVLASSPIVHGGIGAGGGPGAGVGGGMGAAAPAAGAAGAFDFGGIDPNEDPELAMALRVSMEEERARQERAAAAAAAAEQEQSQGDGAAAGGQEQEQEQQQQQDVAMQDAAPEAATAMDLGLSEEEALLQQALAMSMNEHEPGTGNDSSDTAAATSADKATDTAEETDAKYFRDPDFVQALVASLPGVDPNDPGVQNAIRTVAAATESDDKKDEDDEQKTKAEEKRDDAAKKE